MQIFHQLFFNNSYLDENSKCLANYNFAIGIKTIVFCVEIFMGLLYGVETKVSPTTL